MESGLMDTTSDKTDPRTSDDFDTLSFVEMFEASEQASDFARAVSERCRDYYDSKQWTDAETTEMNKRGQPVITDNVIMGKVNTQLGSEIKKRTDPKAFPRNPSDEQGAEAATDATRFVCDNNKWASKRSKVWENMLIEGFGGCEVVHKIVKSKGADGQEVERAEIVINEYDWSRLFYDPHSSKHDFSDATYLGAVVWSDTAKLIKEYPKAADVVGGPADSEPSLGETYEDKPRYQLWGDRERNRTRVVVMYYLEDGVWKWVKYTKGYIFDRGESVYQNDLGESICPLIFQSAYVDRDNNRYGEVSTLLSLQDEVNKRRSKLLHQATTRQTMGIKGAVDSPAAMKRELAKPDGHVEYTQMDDRAQPSFQIIPTADQAASQFALLQDARNAIDDKGATEALMGQGDGDSGRAVLAKQQGAQMSQTPLIDKLSDFTVRVYEHIWWAVRQFWTEERWIRITDDERNVRFVGLNKPIKMSDQITDWWRTGAITEQQVQEFARQTQLQPNDPRLQQQVGVENAVQELFVDMIMMEIPDSITLEGETFEQLVALDSARGGVIPLPILIEASPMRSAIKEKLLKTFEDQSNGEGAAQKAQADQQAQIMELEQKIRAMEAKAGIDKTISETEKNEAQTQKIYTEIGGVEAATQKTRIDGQLSMHSALNPPQQSRG